MNIQPDVPEAAGGVEAGRFFALMDEQRSRSFIGEDLEVWPLDVLSNRIAELRALEAEGVVYVGEKNWLLGYVGTQRAGGHRRYDTWVRDTLAHHLGLAFEAEGAPPPGGLQVWRAQLEAAPYRRALAALQNPAYREVEELDLFVGGSEAAPSPVHLCAMFEALHVLEYSIATLSRDTRGAAPLYVTGVDVTNPVDPTRVLLHVLSDSGSAFEKTLAGGKAWRGC